MLGSRTCRSRRNRWQWESPDKHPHEIPHCPSTAAIHLLAHGSRSAHIYSVFLFSRRSLWCPIEDMYSVLRADIVLVTKSPLERVLFISPDHWSPWSTCVYGILRALPYMRLVPVLYVSQKTGVLRKRKQYAKRSPPPGNFVPSNLKYRNHQKVSLLTRPQPFQNIISHIQSQLLYSVAPSFPRAMDRHIPMD